ncbi:MAG TPA: cyclic dehypoxanthinyl futalosine synthase [Acidobacteriota bacterium]|nr:cyclic dehypoxanthinyl futalosine synthase [Acidobacteriota bacterium]HND18233.1 cyclic dehypoxanthinyl futalosine synthase [Acidobacteriota bacterium]HNG91446.1 cyclic dehypoxanthinyl futalosine synthase [Acidobacteriota bacterium]HNH81846.1 cyclic dehypoxanthinyl futalosine synthase [Acidobacteriota bacterium]
MEKSNTLLESILAGNHPHLDEWMFLLQTTPLEDLLTAADQIRQRFHPDKIVTYVIDRNVNYSNVCTSVCTFCAFYRPPGHPEGYVHSFESMYQKVEETIELGGSGVLMQGGLHPDLPLEWYEDLLRELKHRYRIHLHCFSPPEILNFSRISGLSYEQVLNRLKQAGLDSIPGGGGEILVDEFRKRRRTQCTGKEWLDVMEAAHRLEIPTTATMMYGMGESIDDRFEHLRLLRELQSRTNGFISFIPWTLQPDFVPIGKVFPNRLEPDEYLRWFALSRLYLDNYPNMQVSWLTQGFDVARRALHGGANDLGSIMIEENVVSAAGANHRATEETLLTIIQEEGFIPCKRNGAYHRLEQPQLVSA